MNLVFFGTARFAVPVLEALREHISLVVSQPDRPTGRGMRLQPSPVKVRALELGLTVETPEKSRTPEFVDRIRSIGGDAMLVAAYGQILSQALLDSTKRGGINLHGSILPKYRGAAPIQRCIQAGETETGVTLMQMDKGMDTGDIIAIESLRLGSDETYGELEMRLAELAARIAERWMPDIVAGRYPRTPQDHDKATYAPKVERSEGELHPTKPAQEEYNRFRAFTPSPGAFLVTPWGRLKINAARLSSISGRPGTLLDTKASLVIAFANGAIELVEVQPEGKNKMPGSAFANGMRLRPGMSLNNE